MEVFHVTSRKRETYNVQMKYSILFECALGIAAVTHKRLIDTLEKSQSEWEKIRQSLSVEMREHLQFVEENNTWKALLQLLYEGDFQDLSQFIANIDSLSEEDLKYICLPFLGEAYQAKRRLAASGEVSVIHELKELTHDHQFFSTYIEFVCHADVRELKTHLIAVMTGWYDSVVKKEAEEIVSILQRDYEAKNEMNKKMQPEEFVEWATGGVTYMPEPSVHHVLLIPQITYRPWNIEADIEDTKVFHYPVANESIHPEDPYEPSYFLVHKHKALGDEARLRIVKLLFEQERTLQEITERLQLGKSTVHHHLKLLRSAKLVDIQDGKYVLRKKAVQSLAKELDAFLNR
ncbi:metalloregulator ArsR/SmtB family transcription factor [Bacillus mycoides]|uniref:ArsR/SmtB family transcription factor n=1 Tax=Bacillus TaxID=1386 RepID=UPI000992D3C1|nr:metalloregulator ArsR/SmtB family transcription factor [Bacillus mycoides]MDR4902284.1 metalloregulator ArsR/SmtB family transcription factor [Bacillus mycoides]MED1013542.1 metalloregulator ArsR/SmtB family transcription factor [Bacillus mycoides]MED1045614.1 metalloregulator ArsR/SmtB family transcription factor [Bacillus mycoides]MED1052055.1 metalloregulator ArsR/SmtB family transcription factor [Bacillus mycoides]MED1083049.1 metalloregulator ArsR/SmtB family transcription factor [Baci